jgi:beta-N-acetylhexosaminidase
VKLDDVAATALAEAIAGRAVTVVRDPKGLLPLVESEPVFAVFPALKGETLVEDPLRGESLETLLQGLPTGSEVMTLPPNPGAAVVTQVVEGAKAYRKVIVGTTLARFDANHRVVARALCESHAGVIVVALRNPFDFEVVPESATCVTAYGFRPVHQKALLKVLRGEFAPYGRLPVKLNPT